MSRRRTKKGKKAPSPWQRLQAWWSGRQFGPVQLRVLGGLLVVLAALTLLGLARISPGGAVLDWWSDALRQMFGWIAFLVVVTIGLIGLWLLWPRLGQWVPGGPKAIVGLELLLLVTMIASHAPLVLSSGADEAFLAAQQGRGGGYVGWVFGVPLMQGLGALVGALVLVAVLVAALALLVPSSWGELREWGQRRTEAAGVASTKTQTAFVTPEAEQEPWWEQGSELAAGKAGKSQKRRKSAAGGKKKSSAPAKPRPRAGNMPPLDLLDPAVSHTYGDADVHRKTQIIEETLASFGVPARVVEINQGPTVTQFGLDPGYIERRVAGGDVQRQRVRVSRIASLSDDLSLALAAAPIRIEAPVPGKSVVGLEVPHDTVSLVSLRAVLESAEFNGIKSPLAIALGEDVSGHPEAVDLALMPHLLIAGATGSGKSVCINAIVCCLLFNNEPEDLKLLMVDPKMVELVGYNGIPHLMAPVVVEIEQVVGALAWVTRQMDERYKLFHQAGARNVEEYNRRISRRKNPELLPKLVVLIDELADMMMIAPDEVERHICRLAQMGRATGIHLIIATQRPSVDVVTGLIKANFPARISFAVTSQVDSRVILDQGGAESLLGRGDMLFMSPDQPAPVRLQGCFVSEVEIDRLTGFWRGQAQEQVADAQPAPWEGFNAGDEADDLLTQAIELARGRERISTSFVQRKLRLGFPRAARLMDQLETEGIVGADERGGRGREVLIGKGVDLDEIDERLPGVEPKSF